MKEGAEYIFNDVFPVGKITAKPRTTPSTTATGVAMGGTVVTPKSSIMSRGFFW